MKMLITILTVATLTSTVFGALTYPVVDTAQTESYGSCAGQDAQYKGNQPSCKDIRRLVLGPTGNHRFTGGEETGQEVFRPDLQEEQDFYSTASCNSCSSCPASEATDNMHAYNVRRAWFKTSRRTAP